MAVFGIDLYGLSKYGAQISVQLSAYPFTAVSLDYTRVKITWNPPTGTWTHLRLIKSKTGYPIDENDGHILLTVADARDTVYIDTPVIPATHTYYAIYLQLIDGSWQRAGVTSNLNVKNYNSYQWLIDRTPEYFKVYANLPDNAREITADAQSDPYLQQFYKIIAWNLDSLKTQYEVSKQVNNTNIINMQALESLATTIGVPFTTEITGDAMRNWVSNASHLNREKGTLGGLNNLIKTVTGYDTDITSGPNLMLDDDQASFLNPQYPLWSAFTNYAVGEVVQYNGYWFQANVGGAFGTSQAPNTNGTSNTYWTTYGGGATASLTKYLLNPLTGGQYTWEAYTNVAGINTDYLLALSLGEGVQSPLTSTANQLSNALYISNVGTTATPLSVRSVARRMVTSGTLTGASNLQWGPTQTSVAVAPTFPAITINWPPTPFIARFGWEENKNTFENVLVTSVFDSVAPSNHVYFLTVQRGFGNTARAWPGGTSVSFKEANLDYEQVIFHSVPVPVARDTQEWSEEVLYETNDIVTYSKRPYIALRSSLNNPPPYPNFDIPNDYWAAIGYENDRIALMVSGYTHADFISNSKLQLPVYPFVEWYDEQGNFITKIVGDSTYTAVQDVSLATTAALPNSTFATTNGGTLTQVSPFSALTIDGQLTSTTVPPPSAGTVVRVLVKNQSNAATNGIYTVTNNGSGTQPWILTRAADVNSSTKMVPGLTVRVIGGSTNTATRWALSTSGAVNLNTTPLFFVANPKPWGYNTGIIYDSFSNGWGTNSLNNRGPDLGVNHWNSTIGTWNIDSFNGGSAHPAAGITRAVGTIGAGSSGTVAVTFLKDASGGLTQGLLFRYQDNNNYWRAERTKLSVKFNGSVSTVGTYTSNVQDGDRMYVVLNGTSIKIYLNNTNGTPILSTTDSRLSGASQAGMIVE